MLGLTYLQVPVDKIVEKVVEIPVSVRLLATFFCSDCLQVEHVVVKEVPVEVTRESCHVEKLTPRRLRKLSSRKFRFRWRFWRRTR